jgi:hypothetical protein
VKKLLSLLGFGLVAATAFSQQPAGEVASVAPPAAATSAAATTGLDQPSGAKVWVGHYAEFEDYLKNAEIEKIDDIPVGVTKPQRAFFVPGGLAGSAALKHLPTSMKTGFWESYKSEIAAYKMDRLLDLNMVPPTVERRVSGELASLQLWVNDSRLLNSVNQAECPKPEAWAKQVCRQRVFDNLIANIDRNEGNLLVDGEWNLILIDHSRAFGINRMPFEKEMTRVDRDFYERIKQLDLPTLMREIKPWVLGGGSVKDILKRRDKIVAHFDELVREKGEAAVFPF